jgi:hypothetical protein
MNQSGFDEAVGQFVQIPRCDRWQAYQRLQDLGISCRCLEDGRLRVDAESFTDALLVRSVVKRLTDSRLQLVHWLERCWQVES